MRQNRHRILWLEYQRKHSDVISLCYYQLAVVFKKLNISKFEASKNGIPLFKMYIGQEHLKRKKIKKRSNSKLIAIRTAYSCRKNKSKEKNQSVEDKQVMQQNWEINIQSPLIDREQNS